MKKVTINGKEYGLAYNLRSLFVYEEVAGHPYKGEKTIDTYLLFRAMLSANNADFALDFDEFVNACDEDMNLYQAFVEVMEDHWKRVSSFVDNKKKAVTQ
jgi:hypothetical protein